MRWLFASALLIVLLYLVDTTSGKPSGSNFGYDDDSVPAETGHKHHKAKGRLQIKVYRGPSDGHHASWGYWLKHPEDDHHKGR